MLYTAFLNTGGRIIHDAFIHTVDNGSAVLLDTPTQGFQEVKAHVVPMPGATLSAEALGAWCAEALAYYKVPSHWEIRETPLPRTPTGKIVKAALDDPSALTFTDDDA